MKKVIVDRKLEFTLNSAPKVDLFFEAISNIVEEGQIGKKDHQVFNFSREEKLKLFEFFRPIATNPNSRIVPLNESTEQEYWVTPAEIMNLLFKHR